MYKLKTGQSRGCDSPNTEKISVVVSDPRFPLHGSYEMRTADGE